MTPTKKRPLEVGDRVKLRGYGHDGVDVDGQRGKILRIDDGYSYVDIGNEYAAIVKPSQCIRLVPKKRREIWVNEYNCELTAHPSKEQADRSAGSARIRCIRFVEAKE